MERENHKSELDATLDIITTGPAIESLLADMQNTELWAAGLKENREFLLQRQDRKKTIEALDDVTKNLETASESLGAAVKKGRVKEEQVEKLYGGLGGLLDDPDYERLALYLPFEWLPDNKWQPVSPGLLVATDKFKRSYLKAWTNLLFVHDVRANFVDGDVMEVDQRRTDPQRVVKAAHLIPVLLQKGLLELPDIAAILKSTSDEVLKKSTLDAMLVVANKKDEISKFGPLAPTSFEAIRSDLNQALAEVFSTDYSGMTDKRKAWLIYNNVQKRVSELAQDLSAQVIDDSLSNELLANIFSDQRDELSKQVLVEAIGNAIDSIGLTDRKTAQTIYDKYKVVLWSLWKQAGDDLKESLTKSFRHFCQLGLISEQELQEAGIDLPVLSGQLSDNLKFTAEEEERLWDLIAKAESDPELAELIYPVVLVFGSRLKGYGGLDADIDLAVFVRPDRPPESADRIRELLNTAALGINTEDRIIEFWLDEKDDQLKIHDFTDFDGSKGESYWAHVLFGAAWVGQKNAIKELHQKLLPGYFYETDDQIHGHEARKLWLEEMERDLLQYRLMHKGYERHYPPAKKPMVLSDSIDGGSVFWDSGYRQLATKLFIEKVFLPKLSK